MKIVQVTYAVKDTFVEQNQVNIRAVMADLQAINNPGINYHTCQGADGKTFTHTAFMKSEEEQKILNDLPSFKYFQEQLKASGLETPPKQQQMTLVGSSKSIFS